MACSLNQWGMSRCMLGRSSGSSAFWRSCSARSSSRRRCSASRRASSSRARRRSRNRSTSSTDQPTFRRQTPNTTGHKQIKHSHFFCVKIFRKHPRTHSQQSQREATKLRDKVNNNGTRIRHCLPLYSPMASMRRELRSRL